jgi:hypothetical protein
VLTKHDFCLFDMLKNISSQLFDLDIENALDRGSLAKFELSLYLIFRQLWVLFRWAHACFELACNSSMAFVAGRSANLVELARCDSRMYKLKPFRGFAGRVGRVRPALQAQFQHLEGKIWKCGARARAEKNGVESCVQAAGCVH